MKIARCLIVAATAAVLLSLAPGAQAATVCNAGSPDFATLAAAVTDANTNFPAGGVTYDVCAGFTETAPAGGYVLTSQGSAGSPIVFQKSGGGANPTITASAALTAGALNDGIFKIVGGDWITIDGFTLQENPANTTTAAATNNMTEWGVALLQGSATNGSQNNTIRNSTISLNRAYANSFGIYSNVRHTATAPTTASDITDAVNGPNRGTRIYTNIISNVNYGLVFIGSATAANQDAANDIGGGAAGTGNTITNWGGAVAASAFVSLSTSSSNGIYTNHQTAMNISYNTLTSAALSGTAVGVRGIFADFLSTSPIGTFTNTISNNTLTVTSGFSAGTLFEVIRQSNSAGTANANVTLNMNSNLVLNCALTGATTGPTIFGVVNTANFGTVNMNDNIVRGTTSTATTGGFVGVTNQGAVVNTVNLNNNKIGDEIANAVTFSSATSGAVNGVTNTATITANVSISNNDIRRIVYSVTSTSAPLLISSSNATSATENINNNTFTNLTLNTTGGVTFIQHSGSMTATGVANCNNNSIVGTFSKTGAGGTVLFFSSGSSSVNGSSMTQTGNNFSNVTVTGATTVTGWSNTEGASSSNAPAKTITGNTFSNITGGSSTVTVMTINFSGPGTNVSSNTISNVTGTGAITAISIGSSNGQGTHTYSSNTISSIASSGTGGSVVGITGGSSSIVTLNLTGNSISALSSTGASSTVAGIAVTGAATANVSGNTVNTLSGSGATSPVANGISVSSGTAVNVFRNKIYDISQSGAISTTSPAINGMLFSGGTTVTTYNNLIGDLRAPAASLTDAIRGISVTSTSSSTTQNVYYNTVRLSASSTGANFGSTGIFHTTSTTATTAALNLRNNIIANLSTPAGTGLTVAFRRSSGAAGALANYASTSNNNDFFAGTPGTSNLIYSDGVSTAQTITAYRSGVFTAGTIAPRDSLSFSDNPNFLSTAGASPDFLHISPATSTQIESGAVNIAGITDDFDGQVRQGNIGYPGTGTAPDVGADEFEGMGLDLSPPVITYSPQGNGAAAPSRIFPNVVVTDPSGVDTAAGTRPRVYYKKSTDANDLTGWKFAEASGGGGSPFSFIIDYTALNDGSVSVGDVIQYFVVAQDNATTPNVGINAGTFAAAPSSVALTGAAFPIGGSINSYTIVLSVSGTKTVCAIGCDYATLTAAGGAFADINTKVLTGNIEIQIAEDLTVGEDGSVALNPLAEDPAGSNFTVRIYPTGVTAVEAVRAITGSSSTSLIRLNAADRVTIDGSNDGTGTDRSLSITNTSTGTSSAVIWLQSVGTDGATNNTIKNLDIVGNSNTTTLFGVGSGSSTISITSAGTGNNNNRIENCGISKTQYGIYSGGASAANRNTGTVITQNTINTAPPNNVATGAILARFENGIQITQNDIGNIVKHDGVSGTTGTAFGIALGVVPTNTTTFTGSDVINATVTRNRIDGITQMSSTGYSALGIVVNSVTTGTTLVANNVISGVRAASTSPDFSAGIVAGGGTGSTTQIYFNSVSMSGSRGAATLPSYGLAIGSGDPIVNARNNVFANTQSSTSTGKMYAIGTGSTTFANMTSNFNDLYVTGTNTFVGQTGGLGTAGTDRATLSAWITATGKDTPNSIDSDPLFNSPTNLQPQPGSPLLGAGTPIAGIATDFTNAARSATAPTIGAYENALDLAGPAITYTPLANTTSTTNRVFSPVTITDGSGVATAAGVRPRVYYKKSTDANDLTGWKFTEASGAGGSPFGFTIDYSALNAGSVSVGDTIQYFVIAQDLVGTPNVSINSGTFAAAPSSVALTGAAFPIGGTIRSYRIATAITGARTACASGCDYDSLTNANGLFDAINNSIMTGSTTVSITSDLTAETGAIALNQWVEEGAGGYTLTIKPDGAARVISGSSSMPLIKLNGADRVTFDGSLTGGLDGSLDGVPDRSLTITNTNTGSSTTAVFWLASASATNGATNNTIKNCNISGNSGTTTVAGIIAGSGTTLGGAAESPNSNNTIQNNVITKAQNAAYLRGPDAAFDENWQIVGNRFGSTAAAEKMGFRGMLIGNAQNFVISGNTITGVISSATSSSTMSGIQIAFSVNGGTISGNRISDIKQTNTSGWGSNGIFLAAASTASNVTVVNNFIFDVASYGYSGVGQADNGYGIMIQSGGGYKVYFNSVRLTTNQTSSSGITAAVNVASTITAAGSLDLRNNIFANTQTIGTRYAIYVAAANTVFSSIDRNDYFPGTGTLGFLGSARATIGAWQTATGQDASSISADPLFVSTTDLHLDTCLGISPVEDVGTPIAGVTTDIDGDLRDLSTPDIGADEVGTGADLAITKTRTAGPITFNALITYTLEVTNNGPHPAASVSVSDATPASTTFVSVTAPGGWVCTSPPVGGTGMVTCSTPSLACAGSALITLVVRVDQCALGGTAISNTATVSSSTADPNGTDNSAVDVATTTGTPVTCDDGNACTGPDTCAAGVCNSGPVICSVSVPAASEIGPARDQTVPIAVSAPGDVVSLDLRLAYDATRLVATSVHRTPLTAAMTLTPDFAIPGEVGISMVGATPLAGSGEVAWIVFRAIGPSGSSSPLTWLQADLNGGTLPSTPHGGVMNLVQNEVVFSMPDGANGAPATTTSVPVTVCPADGLSAFDIRVRFNPLVIDATGASTTAATSDWTLTTNLSTPGLAILSLFSATPLPADCPGIIDLNFAVTGGIGSRTPLDITLGTTNDGVTTTLDDGLFTVCADEDEDGWTECGGDCLDNDPTAYPGAPDAVCNGVDNDCDGTADDEYVVTPTACGSGVCGSAGLLLCETGGVLLDTCDPASTDGTPCDDSSACTTADTCSGGVCTGGPPPDCDDANACTADGCHPVTGCFNNPICDLTGHIYYNLVTPAGPNPPNPGTDGPDLSRPVPGADVLRTSTLSPPATSTTDAAGSYGFLSDLGGNVTLAPQPLLVSEAECANAITAADATEVAKSTVLLVALSPTQTLAADVTANGTVSSFDAAQIALKAISIPCTAHIFGTRTLTGSDWAWVPASRNYTPLTGSVTADFVGILYGDVTGNWQHIPLQGDLAFGSGAGSGTAPALLAGSAAEPIVAQSQGATIYLASEPVRQPDGSWQVVLGMQGSDGILGLDLNLAYDRSVARVLGVSATGLAVGFALEQNDLGTAHGVALYGLTPMEGTGQFLSVRYAVEGSVSGLPFGVSAEANEGQIPVRFSPEVPSRPSLPRITVED